LALLELIQPTLRERPSTSTVISPHWAETSRAVSSALIAAYDAKAQPSIYEVAPSLPKWRSSWPTGWYMSIRVMPYSNSVAEWQGVDPKVHRS
jgi:hypothetical protein